MLLTPGNSVATLGQMDPFTYTISNPPPAVSAVNVMNGAFNLTWPAVSAGHYTIESSSTLNPPVWTSVAAQTNLTGVDGLMVRSVPLSGGASQFFRIKID